MPNTPGLHFVRGPTKSLSTTMQIGASGKTVQKKRHNLTGHNSPVWLTKTFFTWSVSDEFAVKCEQFSISRCRKTAILIYHDKYDIANRYIKKSIISDICRRSEFRHRIVSNSDHPADQRQPYKKRTVRPYIIRSQPRTAHLFHAAATQHRKNQCTQCRSYPGTE